jgi:hypothetical protein
LKPFRKDSKEIETRYDEMLAAFFLTQRHGGAKTQSFFTRLLLNGKCFQPFEIIELFESIGPLKPLK